MIDEDIKRLKAFDKELEEQEADTLNRRKGFHGNWAHLGDKFILIENGNVGHICCDVAEYLDIAKFLHSSNDSEEKSYASEKLRDRWGWLVKGLCSRCGTQASKKIIMVSKLRQMMI
jgi:hypothetical protein